MAGGIVGWHFFDVESGLVPEESSLSILPSGGRGRVVVLAATPFALSKGWAARAAVTLAKDWSEEGLRIFLMDLGLETPSLHDALGLPNEEGVSDAFLFGASVQHIAKPVLDDAFFFAPAGSAPGDPEEVLGHPRWNDLAGGFSEANATLLLFLPTVIAGAGKILSRATDIVFLSAQGESADTHLGPASIKVMSMMGPFGSPPEELPEVQEEIEEPEAPEEAAGDGFGAGLELADGFGGAGSVGDEEEPSSFDFSGGLEMAAGFGTDEFQAEGPEEIEDIPGGDASGFNADSGEAPDFGGDFGLVEEKPAEGFGGDLVVGADFSGGMELEGSGGDVLGGGLDAPDFGSDFMDMDPVDDAEAEGGQFGGDLVQGADFGAQPPEGMYTETTEAPVEPPPRRESPEDPSADTQAPERAKPAPKRRPPPKKKFPMGMVAGIVIFLGVVGAVAGTAFGYLNVPGLTFLQDSFGEVPEPPLVLAGPQPNEEVLRFSLVIFTYDRGEVDDATDMMDALQSRLPGLLFALVLGEDEGEPIYTLLVGPALDRIEAEDLRGPLAEVLTREDPSSWSVRETPRAFYLGERETLAEAQDYMAALTIEGIHSYILHVTYPDGSEGYEILSGAFEGVEDARPLQLSLRGGGFRDVPLIERRGRLPE